MYLCIVSFAFYAVGRGIDPHWKKHWILCDEPT